MDVIENIKHLLFYPMGKSPGYCCLCGRWLWAGQSLCQDCLRFDIELLSTALVWPHPLDARVTCRAIFDWTPIRYPRLSAALVAGKGQGARLTWRYYADLFLSQHSADLWVQGKQVKKIIPVPESGPSRQHARHFAQGLSQGLDVGLATQERSLAIAAPMNQRGKSRWDRLASLRQTERWQAAKGPAVAESKGGFGPPTPARDAVEGGPSRRNEITVLVDDIMTTGATTARFLDEIHDSAPIEVWVLARRGILAPPSGVC